MFVGIAPGIDYRGFNVFCDKFGMPATECLTIKQSTFIASMFLAVSTGDSPLEALELLMLKSRTSADNLFAASSKEVRVLVLGSKKRLTTVLPLKVGTFFTSRLLTSLKDFAVLRMNSISSLLNSSKVKRSLFFHSILITAFQ